jgi:two-component system response regulator FixJ
MAKRQTLVAWVDAELRARNSTEALLRAFGYAVEVYETGEQFILAARRSKAACLVVDVRLGDLSGVELSRHLVAGGISLPTIFLSASKDELLRRQAAELGSVAFIEKPFSAAVLIEAVVAATGSSPEAGR